VVLRLLFFSRLHFGLSPSVVGAGSGAAVVALALLLAIRIEASAAAFFYCSLASRVLSATILPATTRLGFFARYVVAVGVVACCVISPCECAVTAGALSDCSVDILKQMRMLSKYNNA